MGGARGTSAVFRVTWIGPRPRSRLRRSLADHGPRVERAARSRGIVFLWRGPSGVRADFSRVVRSRVRRWAGRRREEGGKRWSASPVARRPRSRGPRLPRNRGKGWARMEGVLGVAEPRGHLPEWPGTAEPSRADRFPARDEVGRWRLGPRRVACDAAASASSAGRASRPPPPPVRWRREAHRARRTRRRSRSGNWRAPVRSLTRSASHLPTRSSGVISDGAPFATRAAGAGWGGGKTASEGKKRQAKRA